MSHRRRRASDHQRPAAHHPGRGVARRLRPGHSHASSSAPTARRCRPIAATCSSSISSSTSRARWSGWAASGPRRGFCCSWMDEARRCSCRSRRPGPPCSSRSRQASEFSNQGERVVVGQRLMQAAGDIFLGWERFALQGDEREYYVRQLRDWKGSADVGRMTPGGMELWARMAGWTLARAHARSGDRHAIAGYLGKSDSFDRAIAEFSRRLRRPERARLRSDAGSSGLWPSHRLCRHLGDRSTRSVWAWLVAHGDERGELRHLGYAETFARPKPRTKGCARKGCTVLSMANDWATIFGEDALSWNKPWSDG